MEDLTGNIKRVCNGIAKEAAKRIAADLPACDEDKVRSHVNQVLIDWFLGEFIPSDR
jgi:hypothetical protein